MKIEKLNKENIKEFIRDMKLDNIENLECNINKNEFYAIKKDDNYLIGFDSVSFIDTIAVLHFNSKLSNELFYECIEFLNKNIVVQSHLIIDVYDDKYMKLLGEKYKCKEVKVVFGNIDHGYKICNENSNNKEKFIDIEMDSIKYNDVKGNVFCNFVKQNIFDEKLIFELHNFFISIENNCITYVIYEENYDFLKNLGYDCVSKSYVIK